MAQISVYGGTKSKDKNKNKTTYTQTNTSDLSGTNRSQAYGTKTQTKKETGKTFAQTSTTNVSTREAKNNATKYQNTLKSVSNVPSKKKVDTQPKLQTQKSESKNTPFKFKDTYSNEDEKRIREDYSDYLVNSPFVNSDVEYKGESYQEFTNTLNQKQHELQTAQAETGIAKREQDANADGSLSMNDVATRNEKGEVTLIDYASKIKEADTRDKNIKSQLDTIKSEKKTYANDAVKTEELDRQEVALRRQLDENNKVLGDLQRKQQYQDAVVSREALQYAKETNDTELIDTLFKQNASYNDNWLENRVANAGKVAVDMMTGLANMADIAIDLGGEALAKGIETQANNFRESGQISNEQFDSMIEKAKVLSDYDATDPNHIATQLRALSSDIAYSIQNGEDGIGAFLGQGLDSTVNFLTQFLLLGETGSLTMMAGQSGTQKYFENLANGYDQTTSLLNGIATGVTSYLTEKIGMDNFVSLLAGTSGNKAMAQILKGIAKNSGTEWAVLAKLWATQGVAEGMEELVEGTVDFVLDNLTAKIAGGEPIEYNTGDIFNSMAIGGFSGLLMGAFATGGTAHFICNTRTQYNALQADVRKALEIRAEAIAKGENVNPETAESFNSLELAIRAGQGTLNLYESQSQLMGVEYANEVADPITTSQEDTEILTDALRPTADSQLKTALEQDALVNNIINTSTDFLAMKGVNMDASQFVELDEQQRNYLLNNAEKIQTACPNANVGYATYFEVPVIDDNGNVIGYRNAMEDSNAIVIKNEGGRPTIVVNPKGETSAVVSAVHEIIHTIEGTPEYNALFEFVFEGGISGEHFKEKYAELTGDRYAYTKKKGFEGYREAMKECLTCTVTEDMMDDAGAQAFIDHMAKYNTSTAYKLLYKFKEMTGLFKDNSALGRINAMLTEALSKQDVVYTESGIAYSTMPTEQQMDLFYKNPHTALYDNGTPLMPLSRMDNYKWMPSSEGTYPTVFGRGTVEILATGQKTKTSSAHSSVHGKVSEQVFKNLDYLIDNPIAVFASKSVEGDYIAILNARDLDGNVIIVSVRPQQNVTKTQEYLDDNNAHQSSRDTHVVTGAYGKDAWETTGNDVGRRNFTKQGKLAFDDYFSNNPRNFYEDILGGPVYPNNMSKAEAKRLTENLQLAPKGVVSLDPTIDDYLRKSEQLDNARARDSKYDNNQIGDFYSFREASEMPSYTRDWSQYDIDKTMKTGHTIVYATSPIQAGVEVTPSLDEAVRSANDKRIYEQDVYTSNVLWNDSLSGIYEPVGPEYVKKVGDKITDLSKIVDSKNVSDEYRDGFIKDARTALGEYAKDLGDGFTWKKLQKNNGTKAVLDEIDRIAKSYPQTYLDDSRTEIRDNTYDQFITKEIEGKSKERKGVFYLGLPSAGKSTAGAREGKKALNAVEPDPDIIQSMLPEYKEKGGIMANALHKEASALMKELRNMIIEDGYNLVIPTVGEDYDSVKAYLDNVTSEGYNIGIELVDVPLEEALKRMVKRFVSTGRWVPPSILLNAGLKPKQVYQKLKTEYKAKGNGRVSFYEHVDNSGKAPVVVERLGDRDAFFQTSSEGKNAQELQGNDSETGTVRGTGDGTTSGMGRSNGGTTTQYSRQSKQVGEYSDDFIRVQKESERVSRETRWGSPSRHFNENLQRRLSRVFSEELHSRNYSDGNADGLLKNTGDFKILKDVDGQTFHDIFNIARTYLPFGELVDVHPVETNDDWTGYNDTKNYLSSDGLSGFAITKDGDLISVFNLNRTKKGFLKSIAPFIRDNAKTLDCYVLNNKVNLQQLYHDIFGFETKEVVDYNYDYDHDDIGKRYKEPKVAFMYNPKTTIQYSSASHKAIENMLKSENQDVRKRANALLDASFDAERMEREGKSAKEIWDKTGWIKKDDGYWRFQFYDGAIDTVNKIADVINENYKGKNFADATSYEKEQIYSIDKIIGKDNVLFDMYPELKNIMVIFNIGENDGTRGYYNDQMKMININLAEYEQWGGNMYFSDFDMDNIDQTFFHELQHAIQAQEGFEGGSNMFFATNEVLQKKVEEARIKKAEVRKNLIDSGLNRAEIIRALMNYKNGDIANINFSNSQYRLLTELAEIDEFLNNPLGAVESDDNIRSEIARRYHNNLGEIEAREEAENASDVAFWGSYENLKQKGLAKTPTTKGFVTRQNVVPLSQNVQFSKQGGDTNESMEEGLAKNAEAVEKHGAFDYGMNPARETDIAKRTDYGPTFQTVRTIANSMHIDDDFARRMQAKTGLGGFVKQVQHDKDVIKRSADYIREHGFAKSYEHVIKANDLNNANRDLTTGILLMDEMESMGLRGTPEYEKLVDKCVQMGNALGVGLRTVSLFKRMSPQGQVITIESEIQRIQEGLNERYKDRAPQLQVPREMLDEYLNPKTKEERRTELRGEIAKNIADQIPPTIWEKLNAFRHLSMLFNPRTWVKNRLANEVFGYINEMTRMVRTVGESVYSQFDKDFEKEAGIYNPLSTQDRAWYKKFNDDYFKNVKSHDGKYVSAIDAGDILLDTEFGREISENRKQFSTKFMNWFAETNKKMLSDDPAKSKAYAKSMVGWFKAHNLTPETATPQQMEKAREFALKEALYATFNTDNMLAKAIIQYEKYGDKHFGKVAGKVNRMVVESFIPFKRTPLNLMKTGMSYTPLGLVKSLVYDGLIKVRNGDMTANQFINNMAQGLTGTGLFLLGALLKSLGVFRTKDDDKDRKKYFDKDNGEQDYSLDFGDFTYTIDWLDPLIVPLAMGAEFSKLIEDGDFTSDEIYTLGTAMAQPIFDTSMMSGITNNLKSYASDPAEYTTGLGANAITNYASQYIPSVAGALARTIDDTRRTTAVNKGKLDKFGQSALSKIPFASKTLEPYVNKQGEEQKNPTMKLDQKYGKLGGFAGRAFLNFVSPGYYADKELDQYDNEMLRLYEETGEIAVLPSSTSKSLTYQKEKMDFKKGEYTQWHKTRYKTESEYVNSFIGSSDYKSMADEERVKTIKDIRSFAQEVAKQVFLKGRGINYEPKALKSAKGAMNSGMSLYEYYSYKNSTEKQADKIEWMENNNLTDREKEYLWEQEGYKTSYEDAYKKVFGKEDKKSSKKKSSSRSTKKASSTTSKKSTKKTGGATSGTIRRNMATKVSDIIRPHVTPQNKLNSNYYSAYANTFARKPTQGGSKNTIVCPNCGNRVSSGTSVCPSCGAKL